MTQEFANTINREITAAINEIAKKHGLKLTKASGTFSETELNVRLTLRSEEASDQLQEFALYCRRYGFKVEDYGTEIEEDGRTFKFVGFLPRKRSTPCLLMDEQGRYASGSVEHVKHLIENKKKE